jgi:hypothetical protein
METLGNGLFTLANGTWEALTALASPMVLTGLVLAVSLVWLSLIEVEELDRQGTKPEVRRH